PSGHASDSASFFLVLAVVVGALVLRRPLARAAGVAAAFVVETAVGLSRLELGVHWPTDVIVGWALGTTIALVVSTIAVLAARLRALAPPARARPTSCADGPASPSGVAALWVISPIDLIPEFRPPSSRSTTSLSCCATPAARSRNVLNEAWPGDRDILDGLLG